MISTKKEKSFVHVQIADNGKGIPDEDKPQGAIFDFTVPAEEVEIHE